MIALLQKYLRINTSHPNPDYQAVGILFAEYAQCDSLQFQEILLPSGYPVFCITALGSDLSLPALALNHHMDVVCADGTGWDHKPFGGEIENGIIYGRGAQDCKGLGVVHYAALVRLYTLKKLKRTVHMLIVPHEEVGGFLGVGQLIHTDAFKKLTIGFVLDEGLPSGNAQILIKVSERKPLQIQLIAHAQAGHASRMDAPNAVHDLLDCIETCRKAMSLGSCHVTSLTAGSKYAHNVIPANAEATLDIRISAYTKGADIEKKIQECVAHYPTVSLKVCARVPDVIVPDYKKSPYYQQLCKAITAAGMRSKALHFEASSDLRWYQQVNIEGFGLTPFTCEANLHGINESVPVVDLECGAQIFEKIIEELCC